MAEKTYRWTVDVDGMDFGGRGKSMINSLEGLKIILKEFKKRHIKALFFISTELFSNGFMEGYGECIAKDILQAGHELGSHGHFHIRYNSITRKLADMHISQRIMRTITGKLYPQFRAPWFQLILENIYSNPRNHVSILKHSWGLQRLPKEPIFYLHPCDIVKGDDPPNLFCRILYSRPKAAYETFLNLLNRYPGSYTDCEDLSKDN